ncbi:MAG TPA: hypothetical protein VGX25_32620 [Actinophytocola sp.]|uniref:hypothetical protein n=1 Tax=Actinophytocola sp. TaxID=1872138 RepID=UPI002DDDA7EB|nr:hypothetical protein [Actinophytocola sp.]HEV2784156.1 hypothetical protein [Actinophytocola sp.]
MWREKGRRWSLVAVVAGVLVALPAIGSALPVPAVGVEPERLRDMIVRSVERPYQGYAETTGMLSVPDLPNLEQVTSLINGTTRVRSWYDGPSRWRFDVLTAGAERDVYRTPDGEYIWDFGANLVTEVIGAQPVRLPRAGDLLPPDLARWVLRAAPEDRVEALRSRRVAGIAAAGLRLRPADPDTSIGRVDIWADPQTGLPVRVEATARGAGQPFLVTEFLELSLTRPAAETVTPPLPPDSGYNVTVAPDIVNALGAAAPASLPDTLAGRPLRADDLGGLPGVGQYGGGLSSFVVLPLPRNVGGSATDAARKGGGRELTLPGGTGMLLTVPPLTVIIERSNVARRSYLIAGLISPAVLERAAAELSLVPRSRS